MERRQIQLTIYSKPVSLNASYATAVVRRIGKNGRPYMAARFYAKENHHKIKRTAGLIGLETMNTLGYQPTESPVSVTLNYYFQNRRSDVTNFEKPILDGLEGVVFKNDSQVGDNTRPEFQDKIYTCAQRKYLDKNNPRVEIDITWYEPITERVKNERQTERKGSD